MAKKRKSNKVLYILIGLVVVLATDPHFRKMDFSRFPSRAAWQQPERVLETLGVGGDTQIAIGALREQNVLCGTRGGRLRVSIAPYNDESDVEVFINAIAEVPAA